MDNAYGDDMDFEEDLMDEEVYRVPIEMVVYLRDRSEPLFAEHIFFFQKEDPIKSLNHMMSFVATWWDSLSDDRNMTFIFLTDKDYNKKAILLKDIVAVSFVTPPTPEWMNENG